jgi:hypothetical protein
VINRTVVCREREREHYRAEDALDIHWRGGGGPFLLLLLLLLLLLAWWHPARCWIVFRQEGGVGRENLRRRMATLQI